MQHEKHQRRGTLIFVIGVVVVLVAVALGYRLILGRPEVPPLPPPPPAPVEAAGAQLTRADGVVQLRFGEGAWQAASVGAPVVAGTDVRTGAGATAALSYAGAVEVEVAADAELRLETLDERTTAIVVREGLVMADVKAESGRLLQMRAAGSDAVAETRDGRVHVLTDGKGTVQAAVTRGSATVTAAGEQLTLTEGTATTVAPGAKPAAPTSMPSSLLLRIKWPPERTTAKKRQLVTGKTNPGARVRIGDAVVFANAKGEIRQVVELQEGANEVGVYAVDVYGRIERSQSPPIELDTKAPFQEIQTDPTMWNAAPRK